MLSSLGLMSKLMKIPEQLSHFSILSFSLKFPFEILKSKKYLLRSKMKYHKPLYNELRAKDS